jgi:hypothetical protein
MAPGARMWLCDPEDQIMPQRLLLQQWQLPLLFAALLGVEVRHNSVFLATLQCENRIFHFIFP